MTDEMRLAEIRRRVADPVRWDLGWAHAHFLLGLLDTARSERDAALSRVAAYEAIAREWAATRETSSASFALVADLEAFTNLTSLAALSPPEYPPEQMP